MKMGRKDPRSSVSKSVKGRSPMSRRAKRWWIETTLRGLSISEVLRVHTDATRVGVLPTRPPHAADPAFAGMTEE